MQYLRHCCFPSPISSLTSSDFPRHNQIYSGRAAGIAVNEGGRGYIHGEGIFIEKIICSEIIFSFPKPKAPRELIGW